MVILQIVSCSIKYEFKMFLYFYRRRIEIRYSIIKLLDGNFYDSVFDLGCICVVFFRSVQGGETLLLQATRDWRGGLELSD